MAEQSSEGSFQSRLTSLSPEARARVEAALKTTIDAELASEAGQRLSGQFSRGWIFSRVVNALPEQELINEAMQLDDAKFSQFAERLVRLKQMKP